MENKKLESELHNIQRLVDRIPALTAGQLVTTKSGEQYFVCGKSRIKVSEHFAKEGKP